jgi:hypothetical protein
MPVLNGNQETSPTGIKVVIVGAGKKFPSRKSAQQVTESITGFGGLTAAIECHRQGHTVEIYESFPGTASGR